MSLKYSKADSRVVLIPHIPTKAPQHSIPSDSLKQIIHPRVTQDFYKYVPLSKHTKDNTKFKSIKNSQSVNRVTDTRKKYIRSTRNIIRVSGHSPVKNESLLVHQEPIKMLKTNFKPKHSSVNLLKPSSMSPIQDVKIEKLRGIKKNMHIKPYMITRNTSPEHLSDISLESSRSPTIKLKSIIQYTSNRGSSFLSKLQHKMQISSLPAENRSLSVPKFTILNETPSLKELELIPDDVDINDYRITELGSDEEELPLLKYTPRYSII